MTEYLIVKNDKKITRIKSSKEFAESLALQLGGEAIKIIPVKPDNKSKPLKSRMDKILDKLTKEKKI